MARQIDFWTLLKLTQEYVSQHYAAVLTDKNKLGQLKAYVDKYLRDNDYHVENLTTKELIDKLLQEIRNTIFIPTRVGIVFQWQVPILILLRLKCIPPAPPTPPSSTA